MPLEPGHCGPSVIAEAEGDGVIPVGLAEFGDDTGEMPAEELNTGLEELDNRLAVTLDELDEGTGPATLSPAFVVPSWTKVPTDDLG